MCCRLLAHAIILLVRLVLLKAREWLEARVWADGRVCPHCGNADQDKLTKLEGEAHRPGVYQCNETECRQQFTVTVNTVFERSKIPLTKWLAALFLMTPQRRASARTKCIACWASATNRRGS